jgi:hypothetical protein
MASNCGLMTFSITSTFCRGQIAGMGKLVDFAFEHAKARPRDQHGPDVRHLPFDNDQSVLSLIKRDHTLRM